MDMKLTPFVYTDKEIQITLDNNDGDAFELIFKRYRLSLDKDHVVGVIIAKLLMLHKQKILAKQ